MGKILKNVYIKVRPVGAIEIKLIQMNNKIPSIYESGLLFHSTAKLII